MPHRYENGRERTPTPLSDLLNRRLATIQGKPLRKPTGWTTEERRYCEAVLARMEKDERAVAYVADWVRVRD